MIVYCGGKDLLNEMLNGLGKRQDAMNALPRIAVVQIPCNSAYAMSYNMKGWSRSPSLATLATVKGVRTPLDLVSITEGKTRILSFLSQAVGVPAGRNLLRRESKGWALCASCVDISPGVSSERKRSGEGCDQWP